MHDYVELAHIFEQYRVERVYIFGSQARGDARCDSDYDFLVDFSQGASMLDWGGLVEDLSAYLGRSVDVVSRRALEDDGFASTTWKDARVIYEIH